MPTVLITGVSSGIGRALADSYLEAGWQVLGTSRREPDGLTEEEAFRFVSLDLKDSDAIGPAFRELLAGSERLDLAILNAGRLGVFGDLFEAKMTDLRETMHVNVWANKLVLDELFRLGCSVGQVVLISSGASVNGNRGWSGYSISKAALNMLSKLYAAERPETHFCSLAPGVVDTAIQDELLSREPEEKFPAVEKLRHMRETNTMPSPKSAATRLRAAIARIPNVIASGDYADIRQPPLSEA